MTQGRYFNAISKNSLTRLKKDWRKTKFILYQKLSSGKPSRHSPLPHAISTLRCIFQVLSALNDQTKISSSKMQCMQKTHEEIGCVNVPQDIFRFS